MTTTIGSADGLDITTLSNDMIFTDEYKWAKVSSQAVPTLGGGVYIQEMAKQYEQGRLITLLATDNIGWQTKTVVDELRSRAEIANATYTLIITTTGSDTFTKVVRFRNEVSGGAVQMEPIIQRDGYPASTMWYKGTIYLMVVDKPA